MLTKATKKHMKLFQALQNVHLSSCSEWSVVMAILKIAIAAAYVLATYVKY